MRHTDRFLPDPRDGKRIHVRFTTISGNHFTFSCVFRPREYGSPASQIIAENPQLFRKKVRFSDISEVEPVFHRRKHIRLSQPVLIVAHFGIN